MFSLFGFNEFNSVKALENSALEDSRGLVRCLIKSISSSGSSSTVTFFDNSGKEIKNISLGTYGSCNIPGNAETVKVKLNLRSKNKLNPLMATYEYEFKADINVDSGSRIRIFEKSPATDFYPPIVGVSYDGWSLVK